MRQPGFSLIELMITLAIAGILLALGIPALQTMVATTQSKTVAESIQSGLRLARSEAIARNSPMRFQFVSNLTSTCAYSTSSMLWVVTQTDQATRGQVAGYCDAMPFFPPDQPDPCNPAPVICLCNPEITPTCSRAALVLGCRPLANPTTCTNDPYVALKSPNKAYSSIAVTVNAPIVTFGPLGQVLTNLEGAAVQASTSQIDIVPTDTSAKTWRIRIAPSGGAVKLCDPSLDATLVPPPPLACT
jgi:prepilin-type N-terminal cleavage/methylation domain-containing protein